VTTVTLQRLSICLCGHSVLRDEIRLGAEYQIDPSSRRGGFVYGCGSCGAVQIVEVVNATQRLFPSRPSAPLPYALFEVAAESTSAADSRAPQKKQKNRKQDA
jgi:hypothetical protein